MYTQCPNINCQAQWGIEEIDFQECDSCGYPHKRERIYGQDGFKSVFRKWAPDRINGYSLSQRIYEMSASTNIRNGDGFRHWTQRVGGLGNAVNPTIAHYLFECIKIHYNNAHR